MGDNNNSPKGAPEAQIITPDTIKNNSIKERGKLQKELTLSQKAGYFATAVAGLLAADALADGTLVASKVLAQDSYKTPRIEDGPTPGTYQVVGGDSQKNQEQNIITRITTNEEFLQVAGMTKPEERTIFDGLLPEQKKMIITYFNEGIEENPKMSEKAKIGLGTALIFYYDTINDMKKVVDKYLQTGKIDKKVEVYDSAESNGEDIELYLTKYGTKFSENGKIFDAAFLKVMDENIDKSKKKSAELKQFTKILEEINRILS